MLHHDSIFIGVTPAGQRWYAHKPEHVDLMRKRFAALWARHNSKTK